MFTCVTDEIKDDTPIAGIFHSAVLLLHLYLCLRLVMCVQLTISVHTGTR